MDAKMERTRQRALPAGVIQPSNALAYGISLVLLGLFILVWAINLLTGFLVLLAAFLYVLVYTPMKRLTCLNTTFGAVPARSRRCAAGRRQRAILIPAHGCCF